VGQAVSPVARFLDSSIRRGRRLARLSIPMKAPKRITVVLADEQTLFREGLAAVCENTEQYRVVGHCGDGKAAVRMIRRLKPDIAVLDLGLPKKYALTVIREVHLAGLSPGFVVLSNRRDRKTALEALRGGANGYLLKNDPVKCLLDAFGEVLAGSLYLSPQFKLTEIFTGSSRTLVQKSYEQLSAREHQVFTLLVDGVRPKDIADRLGISPKTVDTYRSNLMGKLRIYDVPGLVKFAIRKKLIAIS
jgi:DNA-binding NarL/FixJ family response regulator